MLHKWVKTKDLAFCFSVFGHHVMRLNFSSIPSVSVMIFVKLASMSSFCHTVAWAVCSLHMIKSLAMGFTGITT